MDDSVALQRGTLDFYILDGNMVLNKSRRSVSLCIGDQCRSLSFLRSFKCARLLNWVKNRLYIRY